MGNKHFVKFRPWSTKTISALLNKEIKFSTVYEFNDFNEFRYISNANINISIANGGEELEILQNELNKIGFLNKLIDLSRQRCSEEFCNKVHDFLARGEQEKLLDPSEKCLSLLDENLVYSSVGIFCVSDIYVFEDDSAQLMFAHYAQNLEGIALIYEAGSSTKLHSVKYEEYDEIKLSKTSLEERMEWYKGEYNGPTWNFLCKSKKWDYEHENRIFAKPGIKSEDEHNIKLKALLYTPRFSGNKDDLLVINKNIYDGQLIIKEIFSSSDECCFIMEDGNKFCKVTELMKG